MKAEIRILQNILAESSTEKGGKAVAACIIPSADPHLSEYPAEHWKARAHFSGFDGSAGTLVVTVREAALWTDSRYYLQATAQLEDSNITLQKDGQPDTPTLAAWLCEQLPTGSRIATDGKTVSLHQWREWQRELTDCELINLDLPAQVWTARPNLLDSPAFLLEEQYAGQSVASKLAEIREQMSRQCTNNLLLTALDDIAWTFNLRGTDIPYNPVVYAFALIRQEQATLFIDPKKLSPEVADTLAKQGVNFVHYETIYTYDWTNAGKIRLDPKQTSYALAESINPDSYRGEIIEQPTPVTRLKSIKNETELAGFHQAMTKDGIALVRFLRWLEAELPKGAVTELSLEAQLRAFRSEQPLYQGDSFRTIAGFGAHGAIGHYAATLESNATLAGNNLLVLDSGAQYLDGTTDITRTIAIGTPTAKQKRDFTLVLKGHIALATARFPAGTRGIQLDTLARKPLWDAAMNYGHGTGHGVGHFLNVHEYPPGIRLRDDGEELKAGMVISNEPGLYREDEYGIRTENLVQVVEDEETEFGKFLRFETISLCPIDGRLIEPSLLTKEEKDWLNQYHLNVFDLLSPHLSEEERLWLNNYIIYY